MSQYTHQDYKADQKCKAEKAHQTKVAAWLQSNPEIGSLNNGKYYTYPVGGDYQEVAELS